MIGWRGRIGIIVPSANVVLEHELPMITPKGVSIHYSRAHIQEDSPKELQQLGKYAPDAAKKLSDAKVDVVAFGCTTGSLLEGPGYDLEIIKSIESTTGIPSTTTSTAVVDALKLLQVQKISVASPYEDWLNEKVVNFLQAHNVKVVNIKGLSIPDPYVLSRLTPAQAYKLAAEVDDKDADAIFISCTAFRTIEVLNQLEKDLGKPVISSNQATIWKCMKMIGLNEKFNHFGTLLQHF